MGIGDFFKKRERLIAVDIGAHTLKVAELVCNEEETILVNVGSVELNGDVFSNNVLEKGEYVAEQLTALLEDLGIGDKRAVVAVPGPSVFTKRVKVPRMSLDDLADNIRFEAGNFIPHSIDAVKLDFHIIGESGKNQLDVLVVAVKNEVLDSMTDCLGLAGLETAIVDVDYFALQNMFELNYPELVPSTTALINVGARFSSITICRNGQSLFTGDIGMGGRYSTEAIRDAMNIKLPEAEKFKLAPPPDSRDEVLDTLQKSVEFMAGEFNRQLSFFWSASGSDEGIDKILMTGGGSMVPGLTEELSEKTGIPCELMDPLKEVRIAEEVSIEHLNRIRPSLGVLVGLGVREPGDKMVPEFME